MQPFAVPNYGGGTLETNKREVAVRFSIFGLAIDHSGQQYRTVEAFVDEITKLYEAREQQREAKRASLSPRGGRRISSVSLEQFRTSGKYQDRPAAADIAFCIAAYANGMSESQIVRALEDDFLAPNASPSRRTAYIRGTMEKARRWIER
jgi:hypothetical protein